MNISNYIASENAREIAQKDWPGLDKVQWKFLSYLLFGVYKDKSSSRLLLPAEIIARINGKYSQWKNNNFNSSQFLGEFQNTVPIKYSKWSYVERQLVRVLLEFPISDELEAEIQKGLAEGWTNSVYFASGRKVTDKTKKTENDLSRQEALESMATTIPEAQALIEYLNTPRPHLYSSLLKNLPKAREIAKTLKKDSVGQLKMLNIMQYQTQPYYRTVEATTRVYAIKENMTYLARPVRKALTNGLWECDLKSAQLAIAAKVWNVPVVAEFLKEKKSIWEELSDWMGFEAKDIYKNTLYALMFGSGSLLLSRIVSELDLTHPIDVILDPKFSKLYWSRKKTYLKDEELIENIIKEVKGRDLMSKFKTHPLIKEILKARAKQLRKIRRAKGAFNFFKIWLSTDKFPPKSILAQVAQSYELALLWPIIELAIKNQDKKGFKIVLWQHDGLTIKVDDNNLEQLWIEKLKFAVSQKAFNLEINTELEVEKN